MGNIVALLGGDRSVKHGFVGTIEFRHDGGAMMEGGRTIIVKERIERFGT